MAHSKHELHALKDDTCTRVFVRDVIEVTRLSSMMDRKDPSRLTRCTHPANVMLCKPTFLFYMHAVICRNKFIKTTT
jgi:hypothetical protein